MNVKVTLTPMDQQYELNKELYVAEKKKQYELDIQENKDEITFSRNGLFLSATVLILSKPVGYLLEEFANFYPRSSEGLCVQISCGATFVICAAKLLYNKFQNNKILAESQMLDKMASQTGFVLSEEIEKPVQELKL